MKGFNVSMIPGLLAYASRLFHALFNAAAQGWVNISDTHPRLIAGLLSLYTSNVNSIAVDSAWSFACALEELK
ncbi:MAG: hypothetical protein A2V79_12470 [Betaproteobacteria bacterium RBG_16_56_24]|nr:MAG: hypothetical protein A2V79_12470 [Betaproteobacteria bacterium RBG_16_56_24]